MIGLLLAPSALGADICPACSFPTVQDAVDSVAPGGLGLFTIDGGVHTRAIVVDGGRQILLVATLGDPVVLAATPSDAAVVEVLGGSVVTLTGVSIDADLVRGVDASEGSSVVLSLGVVFGRGVVGEGALVRLRDASLAAVLYGFEDGYSVAEGGLIFAENSDVDLVSCAMSDGSASSGAGLYASATGERRRIHLAGVTMTDLEATDDGGALLLDGELDVEISDVLIQDTFAGRGGGVAVLGDGPIVTLDDVLFGGCAAVLEGAALYQGGGDVTITGGVMVEGGATDGAGVSLAGGALTLDAVQVAENIAFQRGGGIHAAAGELALLDTNLESNLASEGGALWLGEGATLTDGLRTTFCSNSAALGGGAYLASGANVALQNVRFLDNLAAEDGGAVLHAGPGALQLRSTNLLGNTSGSGGGSAVSTAGALTLTDALVAYSSGGIAVRRQSTPVVLEGGTAWWANERGDAADLSPTTPGAIVADPELAGYTPGEACPTIQDWGGWYGPLRDRGSPDVRDPDDTRADIGAYGGPLASPALWEVDADGDDTPVLYDCDELDPTVHPEADDPPYDGIDANCDQADDFDADGDGHRPPDHGGADCDDTRADVYPGADEVATEPPVDMDCDQKFDADGDGYEPPEDCDDDDPEAHPGAIDDDPHADLDCNRFVDDPRLIRPVGCATSGHGPGAWLGLALLALRRPGRSRGSSSTVGRPGPGTRRSPA